MIDGAVSSAGLSLNGKEQEIVERILVKVEEGIAEGKYETHAAAVVSVLQNYKLFAEALQKDKNNKSESAAFQMFDPERILQIVNAIDTITDKIPEIDPGIPEIDSKIWPGKKL